MWKENWNENIRSLKDLSCHLPLEEESLLEPIIKRHPMSIPKYYLSLIQKEDPQDPIRKLSVPSLLEGQGDGEFDTSGEMENTKMQGVQHKYPQTLLVLTTNRCFMYCRHCFRKRMVGFSKEEINDRFSETISYLQENPQINNVLLTGGDSLCLSTEMISTYLHALKDISHLNLIRLGTRAPVVFPMRIYEDEALLSLLKEISRHKKILVVTQFNHPRELTKEAIRAVNALLLSGVTVHNQTVLLRGVNDSPKILGSLLNNLTKNGIQPYYVFQCRPVKGVKENFQIPFQEGYEIVEEAKSLCNGFSKRFRFVLSHRRGKIEILGIQNKQMLFKFHQAKNQEDLSKVFSRALPPFGRWLSPDLEIIS